MQRKCDYMAIRRITIGLQIFGTVAPNPGEEIGQTLMISREGKVCLRRVYCYALPSAMTGVENKGIEAQKRWRRVTKEENTAISSEEAEHCFSLIRNYIQRNGNADIICDLSPWHLIVEYEDGSQEERMGYGKVLGGPGPVNMNDWLREHIPIEGIWGF